MYSYVKTLLAVPPWTWGIIIWTCNLILWILVEQITYKWKKIFDTYPPPPGSILAPWIMAITKLHLRYIQTLTYQLDIYIIYPINSWIFFFKISFITMITVFLCKTFKRSILYVKHIHIQYNTWNSWCDPLSRPADLSHTWSLSRF